MKHIEAVSPKVLLRVLRPQLTNDNLVLLRSSERKTPIGASIGLLGKICLRIYSPGAILFYFRDCHAFYTCLSLSWAKFEH